MQTKFEKQLKHSPLFPLSPYQIEASAIEWEDFCENSTLLRREGLIDSVKNAAYIDKHNSIDFSNVNISSYLASTLAAYLCEKLLKMQRSFNFETVMSHPGKIDLLKQASENGFKTYLYYVATEDSAINIERVEIRVENGGHSVPKSKIVERYSKSINNLPKAIELTSRAYIFDNSRNHSLEESGTEPELIASFFDNHPEFIAEEIPAWFETTIINYLSE